MTMLLLRRRAGFTLIEIMIVVAILGILLGLAVPAFMKSRTQARKQVCIDTLSQIESAKQLWGLENSKKNGDPVTEADIVGPNLYIKVQPKCPGGGTYDYQTIGTTTTCNIEGHSY
jgi:prepilin-type N-terminal cleavage/methylation domain-containing protein